MRRTRTVRWDIEIPKDSSVELVVPITEGDHVYLGIAVDLIDGVEEGPHLIALTTSEARELHTALGAALAEAPVQS